MEDEYEEVDAFIQSLVDAGVFIEFEDEFGDKHYSITAKARELAPKLWKAHVEELQAALYRLWQFDMVDIMFDGENPLMDTISLTDNAYDWEAVSKTSIFRSGILEVSG